MNKAMHAMSDHKKPLLWLAPSSAAMELLARTFDMGAPAQATPFVVAAGARASEALRLALEAKNVSAIALIAPPALSGLDPDVLEQLQQIETPVLALFGTGDDASPPDFAHDWRRGLPKCFPMFVYAVGADMANERSAAIASIIVEFLKRGEGFLVQQADGRLHD